MENNTRDEIILKSCKVIQRELKKLNKLKCSIDLAGHTITCFDNSKELKYYKTFNDGCNENFEEQIVFEFSQYIK